jgi:hypothetical protein
VTRFLALRALVAWSNVGSPGAGPPGGPWVAIDPCVGVDGPRVGEMVALELRMLGRVRPPAAHVRATCRGGHMVLTVDDGAGLGGERILDLASFPLRGRARLLALEISEMLSPGPEETHARPLPPPAAPPAAAVVFAPAPRARIELGVLMAAERGGQPQRTGAALALAISYRARRHLALVGEARVGAGSWDTPLGAVDRRSVSAASALLATLERGAGWVGAGLGVRAGLVGLRGRPPANSAVRSEEEGGATWGPLATLAGAYPIVGRALASVRAEIGLVARAIVGTVPAGADVAVSGPWLSIAAGLGWRF